MGAAIAGLSDVRLAVLGGDRCRRMVVEVGRHSCRGWEGEVAVRRSTVVAIERVVDCRLARVPGDCSDHPVDATALVVGVVADCSCHCFGDSNPTAFALLALARRDCIRSAIWLCRAFWK